MLTPCLAYFIKVNIALGLFFAFYRLFFSKDTFFKLRRFLLLSFFALAFLYPLFDIQEWIKEQPPIIGAIHIYSAILLPEATVTAIPPGLWHFGRSTFLCLLYTIVSVGLGIRFFIQLGSIIRLGRRTRPAILNGYRVRLLDRPGGPFSFFWLIFLHPSGYTDKEIQEILVHEQTHVGQWHSLDVLLSEWLCIVCWINPFAWLLKREVRHNLEYLADHRVLEAGYDSKSYQYHLLGLAHAFPVPVGLYTNFHILHLKNRIRMMNKKRSRAIGRAKYLLFLPLAALLLVFSNIEAVARITRNLAEARTAPQSPVKLKATVVDQVNRPLSGVNVTVKESMIGTLTTRDGRFELKAPAEGMLVCSGLHLAPREIKVKTIQENQKIQLLSESHFSEDECYTVVDKMPAFPGGDKELLKYLTDHIRYPGEAIEKQLSGRVVCSFVIDKTGELHDVEILRGIHPSLNNEAMRVLRTMPRWVPGEQHGQKVAVKYAVPLTFSLKDQPQAMEPVAELDREVFKNEDPAHPVYKIVDEMPRYPGGDEALLQFIARNIHYPDEAQRTDKQGRVVCAFIVEKDGAVSNVKVLRGIYPSLDKEAARVIASLPAWEPGKVKGQAVRVAFTVPITFRLS